MKKPQFASHPFSLFAWFLVTGFFALGGACGSDDDSPSPHAEAGEAGAGGDSTSVGGASGAAFGGSSSGASGSAGTAASGGAGGDRDPSDFEALVEHGAATSANGERPDFGALQLVNDGARVYALESRRDIVPGPFGLPWRSSFRIAAYDSDGIEAWAFAAETDDVISDLALHPSGELSIAVLHHPPARMAYALIRLSRDGEVLGTTTLAEPETLPDADFGPEDPRPLFRMKSPFADATDGAWLRLLAQGEGLVIAFLSYVDVEDTHPLRGRVAIGLEALDWHANTYEENWARVVEGPHGADPGVWAYDEFRWREPSIRPYLLRDEGTGELLVARAWNSTRCRANVDVFAEFPAEDCVFKAISPGENERLPFAITRFDDTGERLGTQVIFPDEDAIEQVPFALAARDGQIAVVGSLVRELEDGTRRLYAGNMVDYDAYIALYDRDGELIRIHDFNLGRGDLLAALRWLPEGIMAAGAAGWDRHLNGMSVSRGADPLFVWLSADGTRSATRVISATNGARHYNLHDLVVLDDSIVAHGFADAPMTHSADRGDGERTFGAMRVRLQAP